jgi:hypothetical protein
MLQQMAGERGTPEVIARAGPAVATLGLEAEAAITAPSPP